MINKDKITGDTHIPLDISKLNSRLFPEGSELTKKDNVFITGDCGLLWDYRGWSAEELYWKKWLEDKPWTTLFVDGNHENFDRLNALPVTIWNGGKVHKISDSIIHLMRGQVYEINGNVIFTFGGARSIDRGRTEEEKERHRGKVWWDEEMPSLEEMDEARENLARYGNKVDYIITHDLPASELTVLGCRERRNFSLDYLNAFLEDIKISTEYKHWYAGHYHVNTTLSWKQTVLYDEIIPLGGMIE